MIFLVYGIGAIFVFLTIVVLVKSMQVILISAVCTFLVLFLLGLYHAHIDSKETP
jgi:VIT1/CCC1 family predicted Fe2+/Mn2+ transporter